MEAIGARKGARVQTTIRLPRSVYEKAKSLVDERVIDVGTFNELVVAALLAYIKAARRKQIDRAFAAMAEDTDYQKEAQMIAIDFEEADWEALELTEKADVRTD